MEQNAIKKMPDSDQARVNLFRRAIWLKRQSDGSLAIVNPKSEECSIDTDYLIPFKFAQELIITVEKDTWKIVDTTTSSAAETEQVTIQDLLYGIVVRMPKGKNYKGLFLEEGEKQNKTGLDLLRALSRGGFSRVNKTTTEGKKTTNLGLTGYDCLQFVLSLTKDKAISHGIKKLGTKKNKSFNAHLAKQTPTISISDLKAAFDSFIEPLLATDSAAKKDRSRSASTSSSACSGGGGGGGGGASSPDRTMCYSKHRSKRKADSISNTNSAARNRRDDGDSNSSSSGSTHHGPAVVAAGAAQKQPTIWAERPQPRPELKDKTHNQEQQPRNGRQSAK